MATYKLSELADCLGATLHGDPQTEIHKDHCIDCGDVSFVKSAFLSHLSTTCASAVLLSAEFHAHCKTNALVCDNPELTYIELAALFSERETYPAGIHPTAVMLMSVG